MKIVDKTRNEMKYFKNLKLEDIFRWDGRLFMKISVYYDDECINAYDFSNGILTDIAGNVEVERIPAELILHGEEWEE